jgi:hypothetical protein
MGGSRCPHLHSYGYAFYQKITRKLPVNILHLYILLPYSIKEIGVKNHLLQGQKNVFISLATICLFSAINIDLSRKVLYRPRKKLVDHLKNDKSYRIDRTYDDSLVFLKLYSSCNFLLIGIIIIIKLLTINTTLKITLITH